MALVLRVVLVIAVAVMVALSQQSSADTPGANFRVLGGDASAEYPLRESLDTGLETELRRLVDPVQMKAKMGKIKLRPLPFWFGKRAPGLAENDGQWAAGDEQQRVPMRLAHYQIPMRFGRSLYRWWLPEEETAGDPNGEGIFVSRFVVGNKPLPMRFGKR